VGVLGFVGNATLRPAIARAATDEEPTVTPYNMPERAAPQPAPTPRANPAPPPSRAQATPPAATPVQPVQPAPAPQPYQGYPPPGYAPPGYYPPPGYAPPPGYGAYPGYPPMRLTKVHRPRRGLVTGGAITFGVSWGIAATVSLLLNDCTGCNNNEASYLWIPIAGPLVVAAHDSSNEPQIFILWSLAEAAGVVMFIVGMVGHDVMEYQVAKNGPTLRLMPMLARNSGGMGLTAQW
jgi:hypothetical protein